MYHWHVRTTFILYGFLYRFLTSLIQVLIRLEAITCGSHFLDNLHGSLPFLCSTWNLWAFISSKSGALVTCNFY